MLLHTVSLSVVAHRLVSTHPCQSRVLRSTRVSRWVGKHVGECACTRSSITSPPFSSRSCRCVHLKSDCSLIPATAWLTHALRQSGTPRGERQLNAQVQTTRSTSPPVRASASLCPRPGVGSPWTDAPNQPCSEKSSPRKLRSAFLHVRPRQSSVRRWEGCYPV